MRVLVKLWESFQRDLLGAPVDLSLKRFVVSGVRKLMKRRARACFIVYASHASRMLGREKNQARGAGAADGGLRGSPPSVRSGPEAQPPPFQDRA